MKTKFFSLFVLLFFLFNQIFVSFSFALYSNFNTINTIPINNNVGVLPSNISKYKLPNIQDLSSNSLLIDSSNISNKEVLELTDIASSNAGKILNSWVVDDNFSKNFVVKPKGTNYDFLVMKLDKQGLQKALSKTNFFKNTYNKYKSKYDIGQLIVQEPILERLPDRLRLKSKMLIKFKTQNELSNIKKLYNLNVLNTSLNNSVKLKNNNIYKIEKTSLDFGKGLLYKCVKSIKCIKDLKQVSGITEQQLKNIAFSKINNIPDNIIQALKKILNDNTSEKVIEKTEIIDIGLLPVDVLGEQKFHNNLLKDPKLVRINLAKIKSSFKKISKFILIQKLFVEIQQQGNFNNDLKNICNDYSSSEKTECLKLVNEYLYPKVNSYSKILINGFTIGTEFHVLDSETYSTHGINIYKMDVGLSIGYGFGVRIPIEANVNISRSVIRAGVDDKKYVANIKVRTKDANEQEYLNAGISQNQLFGGKEFVLGIYGFVDVDLELLGKNVMNYRIDLIELIGELLRIEGLESLDLSKDFIPPFAGNNTITLAEKTYSVQLYGDSVSAGGNTLGATLIADLNLRTYLDGFIKVLVRLKNSKYTDGKIDDKILTFNSTDGKSVVLLAKISDSGKKNNLIGTYNDFGIILKDFKYIPQLVSSVNARLRLFVEWETFLGYDGSKDIVTPYYEVYKFVLNLPALGAHEGVGEENKELSAIDNKIYSKIKNISMLENKYGVNKYNSFYIDESKYDKVKNIGRDEKNNQYLNDLYKPNFDFDYKIKDFWNGNYNIDNDVLNSGNNNTGYINSGNDNYINSDSTTSVQNLGSSNMFNNTNYNVCEEGIKILKSYQKHLVGILKTKTNKQLTILYFLLNKFENSYLQKQKSLSNKKKILLKVIKDLKLIMICNNLIN